jgi:hypothetical protein
MPDAYRLGYRVETSVRELTTDEAALVAARVREWDAQVRRNAMGRVRELVFAVPLAIIVVIIAAGRGWDGVVFAAGVMGALFALLLFAARRQALATIAAARSPWLAPEGGWKMRETRVVARSMTSVMSSGEDPTIWLLYEIPNGDWFYVDSVGLRAKRNELARAEVRITRFWPEGAYLDVSASGDSIPCQELADAWKPPNENADGTIAEAALPAAILALSEATR